MSETKFTPGPWTYTTGTLVRVMPLGDPNTICGVHKRGVYSERYDPMEIEANARLIASAPALYEALENLIEATYYCLFGLRGNAECSEDDMYGEARAALAQARGERP